METSSPSVQSRNTRNQALQPAAASASEGSKPPDHPSLDDLLIIRTPLVIFHVLRDGGELYLIDTGFLGGRRALKSALRRRGWDHLPIRGILLTHGHIDHLYNAAALAQEHHAWIAAPRLDALHCAQTYPYSGLARVCGLLEALCRRLMRYRTFTVDRWLDENEELPIWGGLRAIHLPGHTAGHMGFYSPGRQLLFTGDLFAPGRFAANLPPPIFNSMPEQLPSSLRKALSLNLTGVAPNHGGPGTFAHHLTRLRALESRL